MFGKLSRQQCKGGCTSELNSLLAVRVRPRAPQAAQSNVWFGPPRRDHPRKASLTVSAAGAMEASAYKWDGEDQCDGS